MTVVVSVILISILSFGVNGLSSIDLPYGAFSKEMGPAAQKKQQ